MEAEEITKLVDGVYKNILEKFNPGARQLITAGKGYLKALHGAASASRLFNEALAKIAMNAQQTGTNDIGASLLNVVSVYKEIQEQQMNILKAFYVDLLVPLETNLEKDTKVVQHEQKKFLQQHKVRMESYQKAVATMKKQRKKKSSPENTEKELRSLQILEDQKKKLDAFCEQSYKNALTQERRRYGFVLERQCSIAKHWMAYHATGKGVFAENLENWQDVAASREVIPMNVCEAGYIGQRRMERIKDVDDMSYGGGLGVSQLKKSRSIDAPYGDMRTLHETSTSTNYSQNSLPRAKSDFNLNAAGLSSTAAGNEHSNEHSGQWDQRPVVRALYAYMPSGENQLPFEEGDRLALVGSKAKGWQFGENLRTQLFGWFPVAYTNAETGERQKFERNERYENMRYERNGGTASAGGMRASYQEQYRATPDMDVNLESDSSYRRRNNSAEESSSPTRMFGDTINFRNQKKYRGSAGISNPRPGPPPTLPAPVPSSSQNASRMLNSSQSFCAPNGSGGSAASSAAAAEQRRKHKAMNGPQAAHSNMLNQLMSSGNMNGGSGGGTTASGGGQMKPAAAAKTSLHSSNDSGFANEPPPQPEIDYSDEEQSSRVPIRRRADTNSHIGPRDVATWTLNRNYRNSVDSQIDERHTTTLNRQSGKNRYDLIASDDEILQASSGGIKRTKSFWKFGGGRSEDILAGMSLWQHRDLVAAPTLDELRDDDYRKQSPEIGHDRGELERNGTLTKAHSNNSSASSTEKRRKESVTSNELYDDEDNIYGMSPAVVRSSSELKPAGGSSKMPAAAAMHANYTPKSRMKIMKTIEIDIENPLEDERLSTLKRGGGAGGREVSMLPQSQGHRHRGGEQQPEGGNGKGLHHHRYGKQLSSGSGEGKGNKQSSRNHSKAPPPQQQQQQAAQEMLAHSTEDEAGDSDDGGTLKMSDVNSFFDEHANGMIMKTVKRKDILKQYYTSEEDEEPESDDIELKSTSSDPYDCIVINDHLVRKDEKLRRQLNSYQEQHQMEFQTFRAAANNNNNGGGGGANGKKKGELKNGQSHTLKQQAQGHKSKQHQHQDERNSSTMTRNNNNNNNNSGNTQNGNAMMHTPTATILPRTRLMKSSNTTTTSMTTLERAPQPHKSSRENRGGGNGGVGGGDMGKTYGPWYDFWDQQDQQQQQQTLVSQKSMNAKMK